VRVRERAASKDGRSLFCGVQPGQYGHNDRIKGGVAIFRWFGIDPLAAGYSRRPLAFVFRR